MNYIWDSKRKGRKVHILLDTGGTLCKAENGMSMQKMNSTGHEVPPGRELCFMCRTMSAGAREKSVSMTQPSRPKRSTQRPAVGAAEWNLWVRSKDFIHSWEWRTLRYQVLRKRSPVCECCGASPKLGVSVSVDHIKPRAKYPELALEESNLQVLCSACNQGKGGWDETDWRLANSATPTAPTARTADHSDQIAAVRRAVAEA